MRINDIIETSYNTGPYLVKDIILHPAFDHEGGDYIVRDYPVCSLVCLDADPLKMRGRGSYHINNVFRLGRGQDARYFTELGDEIFILKSFSVAQLAPKLESVAMKRKRKKPILALQMSLITDTADRWQRYDYQAGCDYELGRYDELHGMISLKIKRNLWRLWHCIECGLDFNVEADPDHHGGRCVPCPACEFPGSILIYRKLKPIPKDEKKNSRAQSRRVHAPAV
jgi:hypothetical protein